MTQPPDDYLDERYGRAPGRGSRRRVVLGAIGVVALVGLTAAFFLWTRTGPATADGTVVGFQVVGDDQIRVDIDVDKPDGSAAVCRVVAQDRTAGVVGSADVPIQAAGSSVQKSVLLRTRGPAVVGLVDSCVLTPG